LTIEVLGTKLHRIPFFTKLSLAFLLSHASLAEEGASKSDWLKKNRPTKIEESFSPL
jgi:hypothetical protein